MSATDGKQLVHWRLERTALDRLRDVAREERRTIVAEAEIAIERHAEAKALERERPAEEER